MCLPSKVKVNAKLWQAIKMIGSILLYPAIACVLFIIMFYLIRQITPIGHISLIAENITEIEYINAAGISTVFVDDYEGNSADISITGRSTLYSEVFNTYVTTIEGEYLKAEKVIIEPEDDEYHPLMLEYANNRIDYELFGVSRDLSDDVFKVVPEFGVSLFYRSSSENDYTYRINTNCLRSDIFFRPYYNDNTGIEESNLMISVSSCKMYGIIKVEEDDNTGKQDGDEKKYEYLKKEIRPEIIIDTSTQFDKALDEVWTSTTITVESDNDIRFEFIPWSNKLEDTDLTRIAVYYPIDVSAKITGIMSFRYGTNTKEFELKNEMVTFSLPKNEVINSINEVNGRLGMYFTGDDSVYFETEKQHPKAMEFNIKTENEKRKTSMSEFSCNVYKATLNGVDLFPSLRTYIVDNWEMELIITLILAFLGYIIEKKRSS